MFTCGWCNTHYESWQENCSSCGGPLPPLPGTDLGPEPAPPPREIPACFVRAQRWSRNPLVLGGTLMIALGIVGALIVVFAVKKPWFAILPLGFSGLGVYVLKEGWKEGVRILAAFRNGRAVKGEVVEVLLDSQYEVKGKRPWKIVYSFKMAHGKKHRGAAITFDSNAPNRQPGQPLWVLAVDEKPEQNTIYPPVK